MRAIRGAITVEHNTREEILSAAQELVETIMTRNNLTADDIVSIMFTATPDLTAAFPAAGARQAGLKYVPLLDAVEIDVPGALPRCIRALVHASIDKSPRDICHVYLREAKTLRPDLSTKEGEDQ